jgi:TolB-like protein
MNVRTALSTALAAVVICASSALGQEETRPGIAVMALQNGGSYGEASENLEAMQVGLQQMLLVELDVNSALRIVERSQLRQILEEQNLARDSLVSPRTAARIGQLVGARYMVLGSFMVLFKDFHLNARVVDTETGEILVTTRVHDTREKVYELVVELASQLTDAVDLPPLPKDVLEQRRSRNIPREATDLYIRAVWFQEQGLKTDAIELLRRVADEFPQMTEAQEALRQLETT